MGLADALGMTGQAGQPPDIDPELLKQLMGLGSVDQRYKLLQDQAGRGAQLAGGVPIDYRHGQGTPQLLASLANLISSGVGGYQEGKAVAGQRSLVDEIGNTRGAFGKAVAGAGNNAGLLEQLQRAGTLSGDPVISDYSKATPGMELKQQEIAAGRRSAEAATSPATGLARRVLLKRFNVDAPEGTPNSVLAEMIGPAEKYATSQAEVGKFAVNPLTGKLYNVHTGKTVTGDGAGGVAELTPGALDQLAELFHTTGQLPPVGRGPSAAVTIKSIVNRAAELHPEASLAGNKAGFKADSGSLAKLQTQADSIESFENTALKNLNNFIKTASGVIDVGSPYFNKPLRSLDARVLGDVNTAKFNTARQVAVQEIGKVLGGAVQGGAISDSQRHEVESLLSGDMSLAQIKAAADVLKQDMANRKTAVNEQLGNVRARVSGQKTVTPAETPAAAERKTVGGKTYEKRADGWYEVPGG